MSERREERALLWLSRQGGKKKERKEEPQYKMGKK